MSPWKRPWPWRYDRAFSVSFRTTAMQGSGHERHDHPETALGGGEGAMIAENVGVGKRQSLGVAQLTLEMGSGLIEVDGLDCDDCRVHGDADGLVDEDLVARADFLEVFVRGGVQRELDLLWVILVGGRRRRSRHWRRQR
ncbi:hypothetical protein DVH24_005252 [Malus domestica]|uniref:Uncharacterized protein n=1 Tax=Malus domestica TaxID=3750 RepID=A0A498KH31_MALDO|nr:hypothetical protein DVH24_005252 [Malus domestica]